MPQRSERSTRIAKHSQFLILVLFLAFALRLHRLGAESLWYDETVSVHLASKSVPALIEHTAGDIHPPGYYLLLHVWTRLAGRGDFAVAFPSLLFGVLLVALAHRLGARLFGRRVGLLAAFLVTISPYNVWYSQQVRMYTVGAALGVGVVLAVVSLLAAPDQTQGKRRRRALALYVVCGALGLWMLYYFAFLLLAVNAMVALWWLFDRRRSGPGGSFDRLKADLGGWVLAQVAVLVLYAPWIPIAWRQVADPPVPPWRSFTGLGDLLLQTGSALSLGQSVEPERVWPVLVIFAGLFVLGLLLSRPDRSAGWLLAGSLFLPVLLIYLASFVTPLFHVRYAFTYSTPFYVVLAAGLAALGRRWRPTLGLIVAFSSISLYNYHTDPLYTADDHEAAVSYLAKRWRPGDVVLVNAGYTYPALFTYWPDGEPIAWRGRLVAEGESLPYELADEGPVVVQAGSVGGDPGLGWGDPDSDFYAMSRGETEAALERLFAQSYRVWVYRIYDTVTDPDGFIRKWLDAHSTQFEDQAFTGQSRLRVQGYLGHRTPPAEVVQAVERGTYEELVSPESGGPVLRYLGLEVLAPGPEVAVGGALDLAFYWQRVGPPPEGLILQAALAAPPVGAWARTDARPLGSLLPVAAWPEGEIVRTPLRIEVPPGTPPGAYDLTFGWYYFDDGQPVRLWGAPGLGSLAGQVQVVAPGDWTALPRPDVAYPAGVRLGQVRFLGFDAPSLEGHPGQTLPLDLFWEAEQDGPEQAGGVLQLTDENGAVLAEESSPPAGGRAPFTGLVAGQVVRDPRRLALPAELGPGVYPLSLGRRRPNGAWLEVRRGLFDLGETYPLATVRVLPGPQGLPEAPPEGCPEPSAPPQVQHPVDAYFGNAIRLVGYDVETGPSGLRFTFTWQALQPMADSYKIFLHLTDEVSGHFTQADVYPSPRTTDWPRCEYQRDPVTVPLATEAPAARYEARVGFYYEPTGWRLPRTDSEGQGQGDFVRIEIDLGD